MSLLILTIASSVWLAQPPGDPPPAEPASGADASGAAAEGTTPAAPQEPPPPDAGTSVSEEQPGTAEPPPSAEPAPETAPSEGEPTKDASPAPATPPGPPPPSAADNALPHLVAASAAVQEGDLDEARAALQRALEIDPENIDAHMMVALLALQEGDHQHAIAMLQKVLILDPYNDDARVDLARAQWMAGNDDGARATLKDVTARHPSLPTAMALQADLDSGAPPSATAWRPLIRAGASVNYDSNVTLQNGALANATQLEAATFQLDALAGVTYQKGNLRPFSAFGVFSLATAMTGDPAPANTDQIAYLNESIPSMVGLATTGRLPLGPVLGIVDVRYFEVFTAVFGNPLQSSVFPSVGVGYDFTPDHTLRLMTAGEVFAPHKQDPASPEPAVNGAVGGNLRYTGRLGIVSLVGQLDAKHNLNTTGDVLTANTGFTELGGTAYVEVAPVEGLGIFAAVTGKGRFFEPDRALNNGAVPARGSFTESVVATNVGARYIIGYFEFFAAYAFTGRFADLSSREYMRHQVTGGTRFWFP